MHSLGFTDGHTEHFARPFLDRWYCFKPLWNWQREHEDVLIRWEVFTELNVRAKHKIAILFHALAYATQKGWAEEQHLVIAPFSRDYFRWCIVNERRRQQVPL